MSNDFKMCALWRKWRHHNAYHGNSDSGHSQNWRQHLVIMKNSDCSEKWSHNQWRYRYVYLSRYKWHRTPYGNSIEYWKLERRARRSATDTRFSLYVRSCHINSRKIVKNQKCTSRYFHCFNMYTIQAHLVNRFTWETPIPVWNGG